MGLDKYLSVEDLVSQMGTDTRTSRWDVMVSYKVDELNALLKKLWDNKDNSDKPLEKFDVKRFEKHHRKECLHSIATWDVKLQPPTLQFTASQAVLQMPVTGQVSTQYYKGDVPGSEVPNGDPEIDDISPGWVMTITTPMSSISASEEGDIKDKKAKGEIIDFSSDPTHKGHIVFECALSDDYTVTFDWTGSVDDDPDEEIPEANLEQAKRWIKNHVKAIDFSLASVTQDQDPNKAYLTPQMMVFQLYHPTKESDDNIHIACLSVYIKTKESGQNNGIGDQIPQFAGTEGNIYPIPEGHTASIIISRRVLWDALLVKQLAAIANGKGSAAFDNPDDVSRKRKTGLGLNLKWNTDYPWQEATDHLTSVSTHSHDYDTGKSDEAYCILRPDLVANMQKSAGAQLTISDDGTMSFDSGMDDVNIGYKEYEVWIKIHDGGVKYRARAKVSKKIWEKDSELGVQLELKPSDWEITSLGNWSMGDNFDFFWDEWFKYLKWPSFSVSMQVNFFATTNVFAPGKHIIDIDEKVGLRVPHDFMLVGSLVDPTS